MNIRFWGVRGSVPAPLTSQQIKAKIEAVVQRISARDIVSSDSRERFLASLPSSLYGTVGGNTACVEVSDAAGTVFLLDCGTGIREYSKHGKLSPDNSYHIIVSHFHWDHIQGLPFFDQAYQHSCSVHFYSPVAQAASLFARQMEQPYFPVQFDTSFHSTIEFHLIKENESFQIGNSTIISKKMFHPGDSYAYAFIENGKKFIYATDVELSNADFEATEENTTFFSNADAVILDAQYTVEEALYKANWGHSAFCYAVDFAVKWNIKKLYLFHHEPVYDDRKIYSILQSAQWYAQYVLKTDIQVFLGQEGVSFDL